jgi:predicted RNase H-like HicB family nuclease
MIKKFDLTIEKDMEGYFLATVPELKGCHTQATSLDQLTERVTEAVALYLEVERLGTEGKA